MEKFVYSDFMFQERKYYTSEFWLKDDGVMTKHVYNMNYKFIGLLQWKIEELDEAEIELNNTWTTDDNVLFIIFETSICYWYHFPSELLICLAFEGSRCSKSEIEELKEFQSLVNCVDKSYTHIHIPFNMDVDIKSYFNFDDERETVLYHKLQEFPYEGVVHLYDCKERVPFLQCAALLK